MLIITANYILVPVLILLILFYIYVFSAYIKDRDTTFRETVASTSCFLKDFGPSYYFSKSENQ